MPTKGALPEHWEQQTPALPPCSLSPLLPSGFLTFSKAGYPHDRGLTRILSSFDTHTLVSPLSVRSCLSLSSLPLWLLQLSLLEVAGLG